MKRKLDYVCTIETTGLGVFRLLQTGNVNEETSYQTSRNRNTSIMHPHFNNRLERIKKATLSINGTTGVIPSQFNVNRIFNPKFAAFPPESLRGIGKSDKFRQSASSDLKFG